MQDWTRYIDGYCERMEPGFWGEPLNAVTNLAFIVAAWVVWRGTSDCRNSIIRALAVILASVGIGSFLFHTLATAWASTLDVFFIAVFVLVYLHAANRHFLGMSVVFGLGATALFFPYSAAATWAILKTFPFLGANAAYLSIALLIFAYSAFLSRRLPDVSRGLFVGASLLCVSIAFRAVDEPLCELNPMGTHAVWHVLNGVMLAFMARVLQRQLEGAAVESGLGKQS